MKKINRRVVTEGMKQPTHVVHEGLTNYPELMNRLRLICGKLYTHADNDSSHLSDVACGISFEVEKLQELAKDIFAQHEIEQRDGAPSLTTP